MSTDEVLKAALELPDRDRVYLATRLLDSVPQQDDLAAIDDPGFFEELDRRFSDRQDLVPASLLWTKE